MATAEPHRSLWLREALAEEYPPAPPLAGATRADVAIVGGGFVGLWTAIRLKEHDPACDVVVLEADICGGGASGRNGGMVLSWWPKLSSLAQLCGPEEAVRLGRASAEAVGELGEFARANEIDCHYLRQGFLWTATAPAHVGVWEGVLRLCEAHGIDAFERLAPAEVARRAGSPVHLAGVLERGAATVQPALLVRGLRRAALQRGVRIHEDTTVTGFDRGRPVAVRTPDGLVAAEKLVVATNAWAATLPGLRRSLVVVSSDIVATAPIPERLEQIGWTGGESVADSQMMVDYYRTTRDGRIVFGKGTGGVRWGSAIGTAYDRNAQRSALVEAELRRYYPQLADVPVEYDWGGPIDRTPISVPILGHLGGEEHIVYGVGWSGNGVGPSLVGARILASLVLGRDDEWSRTPLVNRRLDRFPPEPVRYLGAKVVRAAVARKERAEAAGEPSRGLDDRLAKLAPAGLEDKD
jgi:putative aminophosphonate oxidoreductase